MFFLFRSTMHSALAHLGLYAWKRFRKFYNESWTSGHVLHEWSFLSSRPKSRLWNGRRYARFYPPAVWRNSWREWYMRELSAFLGRIACTSIWYSYRLLINYIARIRMMNSLIDVILCQHTLQRTFSSFLPDISNICSHSQINLMFILRDNRALRIGCFQWPMAYKWNGIHVLVLEITWSPKILIYNKIKSVAATVATAEYPAMCPCASRDLWCGFFLTFVVMFWDIISNTSKYQLVNNVGTPDGHFLWHLPWEPHSECNYASTLPRCCCPEEATPRSETLAGAFWVFYFGFHPPPLHLPVFLSRFVRVVLFCHSFDILSRPSLTFLHDFYTAYHYSARWTQVNVLAMFAASTLWSWIVNSAPSFFLYFLSLYLFIRFDTVIPRQSPMARCTYFKNEIRRVAQVTASSSC